MTTDLSFKEIDALRNQEIAHATLKVAIDKLANDGDSESFLLTLRKLTKAQGGMSSLSKKIGINRQNLYRTFASTGNPKFRSLATILRGLGYRLSIEPIQPQSIKAIEITKEESRSSNKAKEQEAA